MTDEMEGSASVELSAQGKKGFSGYTKINTPTGTRSFLSTGTKSTG